MSTQMFLNLPVKDLKRSVEFFTSLGYKFNPMFTDETGTCMIVSDTIYVMLLTEEKFSVFTKKPLADAKRSTECIVCLSADTREKVDEIVGKAVAAGATTPNAKQDYGFMYGWGFEDLDGHLWEFAYMDLTQLPEEMKTKGEVASTQN